MQHKMFIGVWLAPQPATIATQIWNRISKKIKERNLVVAFKGSASSEETKNKWNLDHQSKEKENKIVKAKPEVAKTKANALMNLSEKLVSKNEQKMALQIMK